MQLKHDEMMEQKTYPKEGHKGNFLTNSPIRNEKREVFQQICPSVVKLKHGRVKGNYAIKTR